MAHIYGVNGPRRKEGLSVQERDAFSNLLLLCLAHHSEVDDKVYGEERYPPELLRKWKVDHEGRNGPALAALGTIDEESLAELLTGVFVLPMKRLQTIAEQLEKTGNLNVETVAELRQIVDVLSNAPLGPDAQVAQSFMFAADVLGGRSFGKEAALLAAAAEKLPSSREITELRALADVISAASNNIRRYGGEGFFQ